jgi:hypothetical protein
MNKWISVEKQLPENKIGKLVCDENGNVTRMYYDGKSKCWVDAVGFERMDVKYWMDLPEPPEGLVEP